MERRGRLVVREDFEALWQHYCAAAEAALLGKKELEFTFIIHSRDGGANVLKPEWSNETEKLLFYDFVRVACVAFDAVAVASMVEAWAVSAADVPPGENVNTGRPSQSKYRRECLVVSLTGRTPLMGEKVNLSSAREIVRDESGKVTGFRDLSSVNNRDMEIVGDLFSLLPEETPPRDARQGARVALKRMEKHRKKAGKRPTIH